MIAANRDELASRPSLPPDRHWPDRANVIAGQDLTAGGTWLGVNDDGVVAAVLNRRGTLGPTEDKRSRGELVLEALDHASADDAADALRAIDPDAYRPFNLIVVDRVSAYWLRHAGDGRIERHTVPVGLSMISSGELNDTHSQRIQTYRPLFERSPPPDPPDWSNWQLLTASKASASGEPMGAMCIRTDGDYGTRSSSFVALPAAFDRRPDWRFANGPPDEFAYDAVEF